MNTVGDVVQIHSFKHDKSYHRIWDKATILEMNNDYIVLGNERTRVLESNGKSWFTKEPAICFFFKRNWYNVISMLKENGVFYYCNIGSPYVIDSEAIKYIDYDLDVKVFPNNQYKVLDKFEYQVNCIEMKYPEDVMKVIDHELDSLKKRIRNKEIPFSEELVYKYYEKFKNMKENLNEGS
ncbi:DUF402 domain-containing protein [Mycoplasmatota bacterium]|nr:DUF402 domain-containing protein [Mycoplasmatota bacterium]